MKTFYPPLSGSCTEKTSVFGGCWESSPRTAPAGSSLSSARATARPQPQSDTGRLLNPCWDAKADSVPVLGWALWRGRG